MAKFLRAIDWWSLHSGLAVAYLIPGLVVVTMIEVVARYAFASPTVWAWDMTNFLMAGCGFMAGAYALHVKAHVRIDILVQRFSARTQAIISLVTALFFFMALVNFTWQATGKAIWSIGILETTNTDWAPAVYPLRIIMPIGCFMLILQGLADFIRNFGIAIGRPIKGAP